ncbi:serine/threonine kinase [Crocosphaera chwakensis CCY0110]|uniref:Serine/threonine kinase n=2 Tax=Crocosphaera TaxID=263510 RepID=A3IK05_9CHRO|nr:serine/threonine kinase [Crocosphaera chwakensis CCY0110]
MNFERLNRNKNTDYRKFRNCLANKNWYEADQETYQIMLKVANRVVEDYLTEEDINNFPTSDLMTINKLWVDYSQGKYGFSVQAEIYRSLGGTRNYEEKIWEIFCEQVGWCQAGRWLFYSEIFPNKVLQNTTTKGHLPVCFGGGWGIGGVLGMGGECLLSRQDLWK